MSTTKSILETLRDVVLMNEKVRELSGKVERLERDLTRTREQLAELQGIIRGAAMASGREQPKLTNR